MKEECELLKTCAFFKKYQDYHCLPCSVFMNIYCLGERKNDCARFQYRNEHGKPPQADLLPNGKYESDLSEEDKEMWEQ